MAEVKEPAIVGAEIPNWINMIPINLCLFDHGGVFDIFQRQAIFPEGRMSAVNEIKNGIPFAEAEGALRVETDEEWANRVKPYIEKLNDLVMTGHVLGFYSKDREEQQAEKLKSLQKVSELCGLPCPPINIMPIYNTQTYAGKSCDSPDVSIGRAKTESDELVGQEVLKIGWGSGGDGVAKSNVLAAIRSAVIKMYRKKHPEQKISDEEILPLDRISIMDDGLNVTAKNRELGVNPYCVCTAGGLCVVALNKDYASRDPHSFFFGNAEVGIVTLSQGARFEMPGAITFQVMPDKILARVRAKKDALKKDVFEIRTIDLNSEEGRVILKMSQSLNIDAKEEKAPSNIPFDFNLLSKEEILILLKSPLLRGDPSIDRSGEIVKCDTFTGYPTVFSALDEIHSGVIIHLSPTDKLLLDLIKRCEEYKTTKVVDSKSTFSSMFDIHPIKPYKAISHKIAAVNLLLDFLRLALKQQLLPAPVAAAAAAAAPAVSLDRPSDSLLQQALIGDLDIAARLERDPLIVEAMQDCSLGDLFNDAIGIIGDKSEVMVDVFFKKINGVQADISPGAAR